MRSKSAWIIFGLALVAAFYFLWFGFAKSGEWPEFPKTEDQKPSVVIRVEPDFGYRTGDLVPATLFVKQQPGTNLSMDGLAFEGDFEIRGEPVITERLLKDGSKEYCIQYVFQSFAVKRKLVLSMSLQWELVSDHEPKEVRQPIMEVYTSYTWDGRPEIKDGSLSALPSHHWFWTAMIFLVSLTGFIGGYKYLAWVNSEKLRIADVPDDSPQGICQRRTDAAWARIAAGDLSPANFQEIDAALRQRLSLGPVLLRDVPSSLGGIHPYCPQIMRTLISCERVLFRKQVLSPEDLVQMRKDLDAFLFNQFTFFDQNDPGYTFPEKEKEDDLPPPDDENPAPLDPQIFY